MSAKRSPTPNFLPAGVCSFKSKPFAIPKTDIRVHHFEVFTSRQGTGCMKGQTHNFWNKCHIRSNETEEGSDPLVELHLKYRDSRTLKEVGTITIPMTEILELGWITDRKGNPKSITETLKRENIEILGTKLHIISKRMIKKLDEDKIITEVNFYLPGDKEKNIKNRFLYQARCESEFTNKNF